MKSVVRAFVFNSDGKILLTQHKKDSLWVLPGGHVESWESLHQAMIREIYEEFSIKSRFFEIDHEEILHHRGKKLIHYPLPISIYELHYTDSGWVNKSRIEHVFLMETDDTIQKIQNQEIYAYRWFEPDEILMMKPNQETWDFIIEMLEKIIESGDEI